MGLKTVKFVETIPPRMGGTSRMTQLQRIVRKLNENPNRWAEVGSTQNVTEMRTLSGRLRSAGLQVSVRRAGGGWTRIYARFNSSPVTRTTKKKK